MKTATFYNSSLYKERQSIIAKTNWQKGIYDALRTQKKKQCIRPECEQAFKVKPSSKKKFCSCSCAAKFNNLQRSEINISMKETVEKLYQSGLLMMEISDKTGWAYGRIVQCMRKFNIPRRSMSEATYAKRNPNGDPFKIKNMLSEDETLLKGLGLGIYWGEGDKSKNNTSVRIGNTDPQLIKKFKEFLVKICGLKKEIKYYLTLFNDCDEEQAINFWKQHLNITRQQMGKITIIPPQGKGTYRKKSQFGVLTACVTNKRLKEKMLEMIGGL